MAARQASVSSPLFGKDINKLWPISYEGQSDTACFDNALEFLVQGGYSLAHAMMMMIPEAWAGNPLMDEERRAFYEYNAALMEPWDGPAAIAFTNGRQIGATLDRNGLRPARYLLTNDDRIVMASEMGVLPIAGKGHRQEVAAAAGQDAAGRSRRRPAHSGRGIEGDAGATAIPTRNGSRSTQIVLEDLPATDNGAPISNLSLLDRQQAFGYTQEDLKFLMTPMATTGEEAVGSMGNDTPISALSDKPKPLFTYFKQNFAQVTNPPIDPIREELVMSLVSIIGPRPNLFDLEGMSKTKRLEVRQPILTNEDLEKIRAISQMSGDHFQSRTFDITFPAEHGADGMGWALDALCERAEEEVRQGCNIIILSDRKARRRPHPDPVAARLRGGASSFDPQGPAHLGRHGAGDRRAARGASFRLPRRLRRRGDQSLSRLRDADRDEGRSAAEARREGDRQALHQVDRQGPAEGDVQDGHLDLSVLLRRADFRRGRPASRTSSTSISPARIPASRASAGRDRGRDRAPPPRRLLAMRRSTSRCSTSAATMPCACAARITSGPPRPSRACSTRCAAIRRITTAPSPRSSTTRPSGCSPSAACSASRRRRKTAASRCRSMRWSRPRTSCGASRPAPCRSARSRARRTPRSPSP